MDNLFLEVFPEVKLDSKIKEIAAQCKILKISKKSLEKVMAVQFCTSTTFFPTSSTRFPFP